MKKLGFFTNVFGHNIEVLLNNFQKILGKHFELHFFVPKRTIKEYKLNNKIIIHSYTKYNLFLKLRKFASDKDVKYIMNTVAYGIQGLILTLCLVGYKKKRFFRISNVHFKDYQFRRKFKDKLKSYLFYNLLSRIANKTAYRVWSTSPKITNDAIEYGLNKNKVTIIPKPLNLSKFKPINKKFARKKLNIPYNKKIIIYLGRVCYMKGQEWIEKLSSSLVNHKDIEIYIVGPLIDDVSLLKKLPNVKLIGKVSHDEIYEYLASADVFFSPSLIDGEPYSVKEALACGLPCALSKGGDHPSFSPPAILFDYNVDDMKEKILNILNMEPLKYKKLQKQSKKIVINEHQLEVLADKYIKLFQDS